MNTIEYNVECLAGARICLGFKGEAERTQVVIDASSWLEEFGSGGLLRLRHAPQNEQIYSPTGQTVEDGVLTWTIGESDTSTGGIGQAEVWYTITDENEVEHKVASAVFQTKVLWSLAVVSSSVPSGIEDWLEEADAALETINSKASQTDLEAEVERATVAEAYLQEQIDQGGGGGAVSSVNGKTGAVVLGASDVGALPDDTTIPSKTSQLTNDSGFLTSAPVSSVDGKTGAVTILPSGGSQGQVLKKSSGTDYAVEWANESGGGGGGAVDSVNGKTGTVVLDATDVGAYALPSGGIPKTDLASAVQTSLGKADSALQSAPVTSVNGQTGAVSITIPTKTSDLTNDSGFGTYSKPSGGIPSTDMSSAVQTSLGKADTALQTAPVTSENSQTGAVTLSIPSSAADVGAIAAPSSPTSGQFLKWNGSAWIASDLPVYSGGVS